MELPKTEEELQLLINKKLEEQAEAHKAEVNAAAANARKDAEAKLEKFKQQQALTDEERAKALAKEKEDELNAELNDLRAFKKKSILETRLAKEGLPKYFANDNRLVSADDEHLDKILKDVKKEYEESLPVGSKVSTVVPTQSRGGANPQLTDKDIAYGKAAESIQDLFNNK